MKGNVNFKFWFIVFTMIVTEGGEADKDLEIIRFQCSFIRSRKFKLMWCCKKIKC